MWIVQEIVDVPMKALADSWCFTRWCKILGVSDFLETKLNHTYMTNLEDFKNDYKEAEFICWWEMLFK